MVKAIINNIKTSKNLLAFVIYAIIISMQPACKKEDKYPSQALPVIEKIVPSAALPGTPVNITGLNLDNVTSIRFGTIEAVFQTPAQTEIRAIVPDSLTAGNLYVQVYVGDGIAYAAHDFKILEVPAIPSITSITPNAAVPGTEVNISGTNFTDVISVLFNNEVAGYNIISDSRLKTIVPSTAVAGKQILHVVSTTGSDTATFTVN